MIQFEGGRVDIKRGVFQVHADGSLIHRPDLDGDCRDEESLAFAISLDPELYASGEVFVILPVVQVIKD